MLLPERDHDGAGEGREIHHEGGVVFLLHVPEHIGQHEAPFGIGVDDLDRLARHGFHDVARALGLAVGHVLDEADRADHVGLRLARGERMHEADNGCGTRHVALHVFHARRRLDGDAAGIEHHALADKRDGRDLFALRAHPFHDDEAALLFGALPHAQKRAHAELLHGLLVEDLDLDAELFELFGAGGEFHRGQHVRRLVHEVAGERHATIGCFAGLHGAAGGDRIFHMQQDGCGRAIILFLFRQIMVELVGGEHHSEGEIGGLLRRERSLWSKQNEARRAILRKLRQRLPAQTHGIRRGVLLVASKADQQHMRRLLPKAGLGRQRQRGTALALEFLGLDRLGQPLGRLLADQRGGLRRNACLVREEAEHGAGRLLREGNEGDGRALGHEILVRSSGLGERKRKFP